MTTHISLNSTNRINYAGTSPANCTINLNRRIFAKCAELSFFMTPNSFYNITGTNNTFLLDGAPQTLDSGCYTLSQLFTEILTLLPAGSTMLYNDVLNKIEITTLVNHTLDFSVSGIYIVLGFLPQLYPAATIFLSTNPPKIYQSIVHIETSLGTNMVNDQGYHSSFIVPINVNKSEMIQFYNRSQFSSRPKVQEAEIKSVQIILKDEYGNVMQGAGDWTMIIAVAE